MSTTFTTTQSRTQEGVQIPKPPTPNRLPSFTEGSDNLVPANPSLKATDTAVFGVNQVGSTNEGVLAFGSNGERQHTLVVDNIERGMDYSGARGSSGNISERVVMTTQKIPVEIKTVTTKTTRTYTQDDTIKKTVEVETKKDQDSRSGTSYSDRPQPRIFEPRIADPPYQYPPDYPPYPQPYPQPSYEVRNPTIFGPTRMNQPPIQFVRQVGDNTKIIRTEVIPMSQQIVSFPSVAVTSPPPPPPPQTITTTTYQQQQPQTMYGPNYPPNFSQQQQIIQQQTHRELLGPVPPPGFFLQPPPQIASLPMTVQSDCMRCVTCNNCCTIPGGPTCGECCACPGNRCCYPGTCQCRPCNQMCSLI